MPRTFLAAGLSVGLAIAGLATSAQAVTAEAENFIASYNAGGEEIYWLGCSGASGGRAVEGVDTAGDWIEIAVDVPTTYGYADTLRSAGNTLEESYFQVTIPGACPGGGDVVSTYHTVGLGIG
ncbi:MAG: hypothetical protein WAW06_06085 [bacterium]